MDLGTIFKAYDIRGIYPDQLDEEKAGRASSAYASFVKPRVVAVGRDVRLSGPKLQKAVIDNLLDCGVDVVDLGVVPTEVMYFAVGYYHYDGGIQVSASHNPAEYNGLKMVRGGVQPISSDNGLKEIRQLAESDEVFSAPTKGKLIKKDATEDYLDFLCSFAEFERIGETKIVANANFGASGLLAERVLERLHVANVELIKLNFEPDGSFPKGRPDPMVPENRAEIAEQIKLSSADMGVAWDADGDRCYIVDEKGQFVEGCHLTAVLAAYLLEKSPGEKILYDPRNVWAVQETVKAAGGTALANKAGHTFIKDRMKQENALFAGEMSGHFYFRDFYFADNGLIPFLLFLSILAEKNSTVSGIFAGLRNKYVVSGEINFTVADIKEKIGRIEAQYGKGKVDRIDGLSVSFEDWRFNLRASNTEPLLRLNVEAKNSELCRQKTEELSSLINES